MSQDTDSSARATTPARTYERVDAPREPFFHTSWTGQGGEITSRSYVA
jgi:6-phosphogluconate dehydrogenase